MMKPPLRDQWSNFVILRDETAVTLLNLVTALLDEKIDESNPRPDYEQKVGIFNIRL